jgi:hypothetical protein
MSRNAFAVLLGALVVVNVIAAAYYWTKGEYPKRNGHLRMGLAEAALQRQSSSGRGLRYIQTETLPHAVKR